MARDSLPTRQASAWGNKMARTSKVTAPQSSSLTGVRPSASTKRATTSASGIEVLADPYEINNTAGPSRLPAITSKAPLNDRKGSLNKQQQGASRSRIPVNPNRTVAYAADPKGKGRAIDSPAPPRQRKSPVRSATKQNYSLHESASSEEDEEMFLAPKMNTSRIVKRDSEPVQTPRNARGTAPRSRVTPSSAVRGSGHARTASLAPSEGWSAMKPIPLKTVVLSSPPRPDRLSESESSSASEDEVRLIENPTTSARKRKAAAGEYTWDERSRSCIPKRERSRSRSLTASAHRLRPVQLQNDDDEGDQDSPASNRSHLQERVFPTSENDNMLKHLLTNHLYDRARLEHSTPAKHEGQEPPEDPFQGHLDPHSTFTEDLTNQILDLPDIQHEDLAAEQPIFDFSYSGLPDDESDDEVFSRRTAFSSSDDGFEQSVIHLQGINEDEASMNVIGDNQQEVTIVKAEQPEVENVSLDVESVVSDVTEMPLDNIDPNRVSEELPEPETLRKSNSIHSETVLESIRAYVKQAGVAMSQTVVNKIGHDGDDHQDDEFGHERHHQQQRDEEETVTRSSSVISDLPPSSPPPLPDYSAAQELPSDIDDIEEVPEVASSPKPSAHPVSHFAGPLSPKTTNRPAQSQSQRLMSPSARSMRSSSENPPSKRGIETYESLMKGRQAAPLSSEVKELGTPRAQSERLASPHPIASIRATNRSVSLAPSPSRHQTPAKLGYLTNDQLFAYAKSPRVPQMTPIRLRTVSPAPVSNFSMVETGATPTQSVQKASMTEPDMDKQTSQDPLMQKVEVVSPSQPPKRPSNSPASALLSPLHARASASPLSPSEPSRASRSLSPAQSGALSRMHTPSVSMRPPQLTPTLNASDVLDRPSLNIEQPSLLVPPSPSLPDVPRSIRSPSPNIVAEKATMDLLARVRALRSPSLAPLLPSSEFVDGQSGLQILKPSAMPEEKASDLSLNVEEDNAASMTPVAVAEANLELVALRAVTGNTADLHKSPEPISSARSVPEKEQALAITAGTDTSPLAGVADDDESGDEISDTGLTDARSDTDSDAEDAEVERSLSHARTPSKSPAIKVVLLPLEDPQMSPNVTVRRERSMSRSTASTRSTRSNKQIAKSASKASRKLSFSEIGALDSSPTSVAASIGRRSFDALDSSSEDDDANEVLENGNIARPSPSREIAARQLRYTRVQEEDSSMSEDEVLDLSSSPTHGPVDSIDRNEEASPVPLVTSTPARLMTTLALDSTHSVAAASATVPVNVSTPNPRRSAVASPRPASSPQIDSDRFTAPPSIEVPQDSSLVALAELDAPSLKGREEADLPDPKIESSQEFQEPEQHESVTGSDAHEDTDSLLDLSATLDEARPRTALIVPPLSLSARPSPARSTRSSGVKAADANPSSTVIIPTVSTPLASDSEEAPSREGRSQSIVSRQESVTSQASTVVQVSSADPMAAARAAAILKVHHHYIQEGTWPAGVNPLSRAASGSSEEGERALDDLLKQAEREVSAALQEQSTVLQAGVESSQDESSLEVAMSIYPEEQRERSMSASRHFIDQSKLEVWTRHDWRALEQCFIDELRRKRSSRDPVEPAEVVRLYLESEQLQPEQCTGEWKPEKLEVRVQALIARKQQKSAGRTHRERSHSVASSAYSRAPSDFFQEEDAHLQSYQTNESNPDATYLDIPGALLSPGRRRYARSAEPIVPEKPNAQQDYARHRGVSKYQSLQRRMPLHKPLSRETSLSSVAEAEETQSVASEPPPSNVARSLSRLYPSLEELKSEMRPKKLLPVRGRSVAAAVNLFEKIEEEQSIEAHWEQAWLKRKPSETDLRGLHDSSKRVRI